jgi:hypothetical protein
MRGLTPQHEVAIQILDDADFSKRVGNATAAAPTAADSLVVRAFGLGIAKPSHVAASTAADRYAGLYDFRTHELFVRRADERKVEGILVHELVHALQDQHFGLIGGGDDAEPDEALAIRALYEGDALLIRERFAAARANENESEFLERATAAIRSLPPADVARAVGASERVLGASPERRDEALFPYLGGLRFAWALHRDGGTPALDRAFARPPKSTMEILHPEKYLRMQRAQAVEEPTVPENALRVGAGTLGELRTGLVISRCGGRGRAGALGWEGDRFVVWTDGGGRSHLSWTIVWDGQESATVFAHELERARACLPPFARAAKVRLGSRRVDLDSR